MMDAHDHMQEQLSAYLDGELSQAEANVVRAALEQDPLLAKELDELRAMRDALTALPEHQAPDDFAQTVLKRAADLRLIQPNRNPSEDATSSNRAEPHHKRAIRWLEVAAVLIVVLGAGVAAMHLAVDPTTEQVTIRDDTSHRATPDDSNEPAPTSPATPVLAKVPAEEDAESMPRREGASKADPEQGLADRLRRGNNLKQVDSLGVEAISTRARLDQTISQAGQAEVIYTHNLAAGQRQVEDVLLREGVALAAGDSPILNNQVTSLNQAWNIASVQERNQTGAGQNLEHPRNELQELVEPQQAQKPLPSPETVTYVVYGDPETLRNVQQELDRQVRKQQVVSQAAEPVYQQVLAMGTETEHQEQVASADIPGDDVAAARPAMAAPAKQKETLREEHEPTQAKTDGLEQKNSAQKHMQASQTMAPSHSLPTSQLKSQASAIAIVPERVLVIQLHLRQPRELNAVQQRAMETMMRENASPPTPSSPRTAPTTSAPSSE